MRPVSSELRVAVLHTGANGKLVWSIHNMNFSSRAGVERQALADAPAFWPVDSSMPSVCGCEIHCYNFPEYNYLFGISNLAIRNSDSECRFSDWEEPLLSPTGNLNLSFRSSSLSSLNRRCPQTALLPGWSEPFRTLQATSIGIQVSADYIRDRTCAPDRSVIGVYLIRLAFTLSVWSNSLLSSMNKEKNCQSSFPWESATLWPVIEKFEEKLFDL